MMGAQMDYVTSRRLVYSLADVAMLTALALALTGCDDSRSSGTGDADSDSDADSDTDADGDSDSDTDSDTDTGTGDDTDTGTETDTDTGTETDTDEECVNEDQFDPEDCPEIDLADPAIRYVNIEVETPGDGTSWDTAFDEIQTAVDACRCVAIGLETTCQVWVAGGAYHIYEGCEWDTVRLRPDVEVYGGFTGEETAVEDRDWLANVTTIHGDDSVIWLVVGSDDATLDGFTVQAGRMSNWSASPTIANCRFNDIHETAMVNHDSSPMILDSEFSWNTSITGAGMRNDSGDPFVSGCIFHNNDAARGAAIYTLGGVVTVENSLFTHNSVQSDDFWEDVLGAAIYGEIGASVSITNCVFYANTGASAIWQDDLGEDLHVDNSILWQSDPIDGGGGESGLVSYSNVLGGYEGVGNIDADPLYVDPGAGDFHLQPGSPCIDAADGTAAPELDADGNARVDDPDTTNTGLGPPWADMGAYELQP